MFTTVCNLRPFDQLLSLPEDVDEAFVESLVKDCDPLSGVDEEKVRGVIDRLVQKNMFVPASQLATKISNPERKIREIQKIQKTVAKILNRLPECGAESRTLTVISDPRSPYWQNYEGIISGLLSKNQIWAVKALIPLFSDPIRQSIQERSLSQFYAKKGHISEALLLNRDLLAKGIHVGELQEKWQFPSDHLPVGITYDGDHFFSWNVLSSRYVYWMDTLGLNRSLIMQEHDSSQGLTSRDQHVARLILDAIYHPTHPRSILALQECELPFLNHLKSILPPQFIVQSYGENAILIDRNHFEVISSPKSVVFGVFQKRPQATFQNINIRRLSDDKIIRLINVRIPGDPTLDCRFEFAQYLKDTWDPLEETIVMGDMNFNEIEMCEALGRVFENASPFSLYSPYCTNISPYTLQSKAIDHFLVDRPKEDSVQVNAPNDVLPNLQSHLSLLGRKIFI